MQSQKKIKSIKNKLTYLACLSVLVFSFVFYLYSVSGSVFLAKAASGITYGSESNQTILNGDDQSRMNFSYKEIIVSDGSSTFILMDRNLGAKAAWDGTTWEDASSNYDSDSDFYGYYYQWGNNYGFSAKTKNAGAGQVFTKSVPSNYLSSRWIANSSAWNTNNDLWGDVTNSEPARHGPCPVGWHVPTQNEWNLVYNTWKNADGKSTDESSEVKNFAKDLKLPPAGSRFYGSLLFNNRGLNGYYWSSSHGVSNQSAANLFFYDSPSSSYFNFNQTSERSNGLPVRCFKNTSEIKTYTVTFDTRGGITEIESQEVKELDKAIEPSEIPVKFGTQFIAWTTADKKEFDFSFPIVQDITLYAKWEGESDSPYYDEDSYLLTADGIVVTGVANTIEYLTSLYLYVTDPYASTSVELKYDSELNALLINSPINANAMGIGFNKFGEGVVGSVSIGGSGNIFNLRSQDIYDDYGDFTGRRNGRDDSAVAIGGESNRPSPMGGVVVGGKNSEAHFSNSALIGGVDSNVGGHHSVFLGSNKSSLNVQDWSSIDMGYNNRGDKHTYLIGSGIDLHPRGTSRTNAVGNVFAWSPGEEGFPLLGGGLGGQQGFYINAKNGFGLNTSTPRLTFDFRSGGPLRVIAAKGIQNNSLDFGDGRSDGIICWDQGETRFYRGTLAYVQRDGIGAFCGCNGSYWMPLSSDAVEQSLCTESKADARVCDGEEILHNVVLHTGTRGAARWDEDANDGKGAWVNLNWTFMGVPSLLSGDIRECSYTCAVGFHPNHKSAKGWFTGDCVPCDDLTGGQYVTAGTGINDCEFRCNGGYKYDKWAENKDDRCTPCKAGEWTPNLNEFSQCNICKLPNGVSAKSETLRAGIIFTGGVLWNGTTGTGEPYFRKFTSFASTEDGCKFECASGFYLGSGGSSCVECSIGTYSPGGIYGGCASCDNMEANDISFSAREPGGNSYSYTIAAKDVSWYTTKGKNGPESCEWICNPEIGLIKDGKSCRCPDSSHLELIAGKPHCVSNYGDLECTGASLPALAIKGSSVMTGVLRGTLNGNDWTPKTVNWKRVNYSIPLNLKACEWTCPQDYVYDSASNTCKLPPLGECGGKYGKVVDSLSESELCASNLGSAGFSKLEINYFYNNVFQFYPANTIKTNSIKYLATWTCKGFEGKPEYSASCYAYIKGEPKKAQCPAESQWRDASGNAKAVCFYETPNNCKENLNCPPLSNKIETNTISDSSIDLNNRSPHGLQWTCPGTFGADSIQCHSCDSGYSWWKKKWGCTADEITTNCKGTELPSSRSNTNFYDESYTNKFDKGLDDYTPGILYYKRLADGANPTSPCEWACESDTHYCGSRCEPNPECGSLSLNESGDIIESYLCPSWNSASNVTTGTDGSYHWYCHRGCQWTEDCGGDKYSCQGGTPAHSVYAGKHGLLDSPAWYQLYPDDSPHLGEPCSLKCAEGYEYNSVTDSCEKIQSSYSCSTSGIPVHSVAVGQTGGFTEEPPANMLYETREEAEGKACSFVCEEGYTFLYNPNRCEKCEVGTLNEDKTYCTVIVDCPTGYQYNPETGVCDALGDCVDGSDRTQPELPSNGKSPYSYEESRPIGGNVQWSCRKNIEDIRSHACEFVCDEGYLCSREGAAYCFKPSCGSFTKSTYGDIDLAVKLQNPTYDYAVSIGGGYGWSVPWQYTGAGSLEAFNAWAYNDDGTPKVEGCWYWCNNNYVDVTTDPTTVRCIDPNVPANAYACIGSVKGIRDRNIMSTDSSVTFSDHNRDWTFVESREEYWERVAQGEECLYTCKTGVELKTFSVGKLCAEECDTDNGEYMTSQGYCSTCKEGYMPDSNNMENGVIMGCMYKCDPETQIWSETLKSCVAKQVYMLECPDGMEELGKTPDNKLICGIRFGD